MSDWLFWHQRCLTLLYISTSTSISKAAFQLFVLTLFFFLRLIGRKRRLPILTSLSLIVPALCLRQVLRMVTSDKRVGSEKCGTVARVLFVQVVSIDDRCFCCVSCRWRLYRVSTCRRLMFLLLAFSPSLFPSFLFAVTWDSGRGSGCIVMFTVFLQ